MTIGQIPCRALLLGALVFTAACGGTAFEEGDELEATDGEFATDEAALDSRRRPTEMGELLLLEGQSSELDAQSGFQRWTFEGRQGWTVRFVEKSKGFRTYLRLTAPNGRTRTKTGVRKDGAWSSEITWELPATGTYKLFATSATNYTNSTRRSRGEFTLSAEGEIFCGGIAAFQCPEHLSCAIEGDYPDAGGTCVVPAADTCETLDLRTCEATEGCEVYAHGCEHACEPETGECHPCDPIPACREATGAAAGESCGGRGGARCASGLFCSYAPADICGRADAAGTCARRPDFCAELYQPVCGCDGNTYGNACKASSAGVSVDREGACAGAEGASCGGRGMSPCADGLFCAFPASAQCGSFDLPGTCARRAEMCPQHYAPVCGCDGNTYGNACNASSAGTSVAHDGACQLAQGESCGGRVRAECGRGLFCKFTESAICGWADATGSCETPPSACTREYRPVCGCNGATYSNACTANAAGTSVQHQGACR